MKHFSLILATGLVASLGCGGNVTYQEKRSSTPSPASRQPAAEELAPLEAPMKIMAGGGKPEPAPDALLARKIVYTAEMRVIVNDFDEAEQALKQLIGQQKGCYVAQAEVTGSAGSPRRGHWKVRVPVAQFESFVEAVTKLGVPQRNSIDSKDVTEEYYDLEARIKNKKVEEERLLKHLEKSTGKLEDILAVEREISRVRGEIEQQEGRLRLLANLTTLTTVSITIEEIKNYVPPQTPTFANTIASTFSSSLDALIAFGKGLVLIGVALAPWLPVIAVVAVPAWLVIRRHPRRVPAPGQPVP